MNSTLISGRLRAFYRAAAGLVFVASLLAHQGGCDAENERGCVVDGCGGEACVPESKGGFNSTCEYVAEDSCYRTAKPPCERQSSGQCGWTETTAFKECISTIQARREGPCDDSNPCPEGLSCSASSQDPTKKICL